MIQVPVCFGSVPKPEVLGSNGHMIIQCGGSLMGLPEVAIGITGAPVRCARQHVDDAWLGIRRLRLQRKKVALPAKRRRIHALRIVAHCTGVPRKTGEPAVAFAQHGLRTVVSS